MTEQTQPENLPQPIPATKPSSRSNLDLFLAKALAYQGHRAQANLTSGFGERVGYGSNPWAGAFIDVCAREAGLTNHNVPAMVYTPAGLSEFIKRNTLYQRPKRGDIAIFAYASDGGRTMFDMPHVAIVTDTTHFASTGLFQCLEAQTASGLPKGNQDPTGVFLRVRSGQDVIGFGRPNFAPKPGVSFNNKLKVSSSGTLPVLTLARLTTGKANRAMETLQLALKAQVGLTGHEPGVFDAATRAGLARFQRSIGRVGPDAAGNLDIATIGRLGRETGLFVAQ